MSDRELILRVVAEIPNDMRIVRGVARSTGHGEGDAAFTLRAFAEGRIAADLGSPLMAIFLTAASVVLGIDKCWVDERGMTPVISATHALARRTRLKYA